MKMASRLFQQSMLGNRRMTSMSFINAQRMHFMQGPIPTLGSTSAIRDFSSQVEKTDDAGDDMQQQEEVSVAEGEDANEPPLGDSSRQVHELFMQIYGKIKFRTMPQRMLTMDVTTFEHDIEKLEQAFVDACGGLNKNQVRIIVRNKPTALFFEEDFAKSKIGLRALISVFHEEKGIEMDRIVNLFVRNPAYLSKSIEQLQQFFIAMAEQGVENDVAFELLEDCPRLISENHAAKFKEQLFLFDLYLKMDHEKYMKIVRGFPYVLCLD